MLEKIYRKRISLKSVKAHEWLNKDIQSKLIVLIMHVVLVMLYNYLLNNKLSYDFTISFCSIFSNDEMILSKTKS